MRLSVRRLEPVDAEAATAWHGSIRCPCNPPPSPATIDQPGTTLTWFGAFEDDLLVARLIDREYHSFFGGVPVPTCGVAGVTVAAEHRGQGILRHSLTASSGARSTAAR